MVDLQHYIGDRMKRNVRHLLELIRMYSAYKKLHENIVHNLSHRPISLFEHACNLLISFIFTYPRLELPTQYYNPP